HQALKATVLRIGKALGVPAADISDDQIDHFEALSVTNEWDSAAICAALILLEAWRFDPGIRLGHQPLTADVLTDQVPKIYAFLDTFNKVGDLPTISAYQKITRENPGLNANQRDYLENILYNSRDIYQSPILPWHQETVLGSRDFQDNYSLEPRLNIESFLTIYDRPVMSVETRKNIQMWLRVPGHHAGIMTNRPSSTPAGYLSSPEAELGANLVELDHLPLLGSGMLAWFAVTQCALPDHTFLKPNPVHALALMQMCLGEPLENGLKLAYDLWRGEGNRGDWVKFKGSQVTIFEDAVKGLESGKAARTLLASLDIDINLQLIGISYHPIKKRELEKIADHVYPDIDRVDWGQI
ncbi:MAG TPA: hypothetical protein VIM80_03890, partial [Brevefilum sp.]